MKESSVSDKVTKCVQEALRSTNELVSDDKRVDWDSSSVLLGRCAQLDSLGLLNFLTFCEEELASEFNSDTDLFAILDIENIEELSIADVLKRTIDHFKGGIAS